MRPAAIFAIALALGLPTATSAAAPRWTAFADCAAAYQANARLSDPDRPASMTAMVSDVANDYAKAAAQASRRQGGASVAKVKQRIARQTAAFAGRPREEVERFIDACPQLEN